MKHGKGKTVSLVLGSGGARGLAHIGVIHWLEENGYTIKSISGCSIGALIGGVYATGKVDEFEKWVKAISTLDIVSLLDISWKSNGLVKGDKIIDTLVKLVGTRNIEDLPIKFTAVAADIVNEKEVWMSSGDLFKAIRASISLPLFFTPYNYKGVDLIDGGVLNPVPTATAFNDDTDMTIAVNLGGLVDANEIIVKKNEDKHEAGFFENTITSFVESFSSSKDKLLVPEKRSVYDIANQSFDSMQSTIARQKLSVYPADYYVEIARNACGTMDFDLASELIDLGYDKAEKSLSNI